MPTVKRTAMVEKMKKKKERGRDGRREGRREGGRTVFSERTNNFWCLAFLIRRVTLVERRRRRSANIESSPIFEDFLLVT